MIAAKSALEDQAFVEESIRKNFEQMQRYENFAKERNIEIIPSYTNFATLLLKKSQNSSDIANNLLKKGIIVRDLSSYNLNAIRITVGSAQQNNRLFEELEKLI